MSTEIEYCYSTDGETFNYESINDVIDYIDLENPIGATYWRGEKKELTHADCIDVDSFLEQCDERAYEEIGEIYDSCFTDVTEAEKMEAFNAEWDAKIEAAAAAGDEDLVEALMIEQGDKFSELFPA